MDAISYSPTGLRRSFNDEKIEEDMLQTSASDLGDKDEALKLVGLERTGGISEELSRKVRWKLVSYRIYLRSICSTEPVHRTW